MTRQLLPLIAALLLAVVAVGVVAMKADAAEFAPPSANANVDRAVATPPGQADEISRTARPHGGTG